MEVLPYYRPFPPRGDCSDALLWRRDAPPPCGIIGMDVHLPERELQSPTLHPSRPRHYSFRGAPSCRIESLEPASRGKMKTRVTLNRTIESFFGTRDENIRVLEGGLGVLMRQTSDAFEIEGDEGQVARAERIVLDYLNLADSWLRIPAADLNSYLRVLAADPGVTFKELVDSGK